MPNTSTVISKTKPKILITQPYSSNLAFSYDKIVKKYGVDVRFQPFIYTQPVPIPIFRKYKQAIANATAYLFTTKTSIDCFFKLSQACGFKMAPGKRYFCTSESLKSYLRKYIEYKKRKVLHGGKTIKELLPVLSRYKKESFLIPGSNEKKEVLRQFMQSNKVKHKNIVVYETELPDLSNLDISTYDIIVFFSPLTVASFAKNFPDYQQGKTKIASFNDVTVEAVKKQGWETTICPQTMATPSIVDALDIYLGDKNVDI